MKQLSIDKVNAFFILSVGVFHYPPHPTFFVLTQSISAIDGWVDDVEDALSKAESSYRQITEDTDAGEKRMLLTESKNLVRSIFCTYYVDE